MPKTVKVYCANCRGVVGLVDKASLKLPFEADSIEREPNGENSPRFDGNFIICPFCGWDIRRLKTGKLMTLRGLDEIVWMPEGPDSPHITWEGTVDQYDEHT